MVERTQTLYLARTWYVNISLYNVRISAKVDTRVTFFPISFLVYIYVHIGVLFLTN